MANTRIWDIISMYRNQLIAVLIPLCLLPLPVACNGDERAMCGYVLLWLSFYYITQVIPLGMSAMLPVLLFPLLGVASSSSTAAAYAAEAVAVQFGTLICGAAFEKVGLHRRAAYSVLHMVGPKPQRLLWSFSLVSFFISMLTTNVAAAMAVLSIVDAMISESEGHMQQETQDMETGAPNCKVEDDTTFNSKDSPSDDVIMTEAQESGKMALSTDEGKKTLDFTVSSDNLMVFTEDPDYSDGDTPQTTNSYKLKHDTEQSRSMNENWGISIGLAVKFGCILGGMASPMGNASNILVMELLSNCFDGSGERSPLTFSTWLAALIPMCMIMLLIITLVVQIYYFGLSSFKCDKKPDKQSDELDALQKWIDKSYGALGNIRHSEAAVIILFVLLITLWFFLDPGFIPGWAQLPAFKEGYIGSAIPTYLVVLPLFLIPVEPPVCLNKNWKQSENGAPVETIMNWTTMKARIPWQMPMMFGAGLAAAHGARESGLDDWIGDQLAKLSYIEPPLLLFIFCIISAFATELLSSNLMHNVLLPVLCELSVTIGKNPLYFALPVAMCINSNFMMPNQPVNTLCLEYKKATVPNLMITGFFADLMFILIVTFCSLTWFVPLFNLNDLPEFVDSNVTTTAAATAEALLSW